MSREDVKVRVSPDGVLTISGERKEAREEEDKERGWVRSERAYGSFSRAFRLPDDVDAEKISASAKDGELVLELTKSAHREPAQPLEIPVKA
jgi:HSP20 family protein